MTDDKREDVIPSIFDISMVGFENGVTLEEAEEESEEERKKRIQEDIEEANNLLNSLRGQVPDGLISLIEGYIDYAKEVVVNRALPGIDGLNPVQRRILYTMKKKEKITDLKKCQSVAGKVLDLHPHGDGAVYKAMVRLMDLSENLNVPYLKGKGSFGKVYSNEKASAPRYTECMLMDVVDEFFGEMDGVDYIPSYNNETDEPLLLPVSYPNILCNPTIGIAVGVASNIPPFNFNEVNNATIELIETGDISELLVPDYTTGCDIVNDENELMKLMYTGKSKFTLRGKWHIDGKNIVITEIPYYTTIQALQKVVQGIKGVSDEIDGIGRNGFKYTIECTSKKVVNEVLTSVLKDTRLQMTVTTNIVVIVDGKPKVIGIKDVLLEWVKFRESVLKKDMKVELDSLNPEITKNEIIIDLINHEGKRDKLYEKVTKESEESALDYLKFLYEGVSDEILDEILNINFRSLTPKNRDRREKTLQKLLDRKTYLTTSLTDVKKVIVNQLKALNEKYVTPRRTTVTDVVYDFEKTNVKVKAEPVPVRFVIEDKFMKKLKVTEETENLGIGCMSDAIITIVDDLGRLLRVDVDKVSFCKPTERGTYLSVFLDIEDDFNIVDYDITENKEKAFIYSDGHISVLDYSEWSNAQRISKMVKRGISTSANLIIGDWDLKTSHIMLITSEGRFGFVSSDFERKNRTARTKLVEGLVDGETITKAIPINEVTMFNLIYNYENYIGDVFVLSPSDEFNSEIYDKLLNM